MLRHPAFVLVLLPLLAAFSIQAAPPGDVGATLVWSDADTLEWQAVAGATRYNVYRGNAADGSDLGCFVFRTTATNADDVEVPGALATYLVAAWNVEGEGPLGDASDGTPRASVVPCLDDDGDDVGDHVDNCVGVSNPSQLDQNANGLGDPCDPRTYDFEADVLGQRPADTTPDGGGVNDTFAVRVVGAEQGASYDGDALGRHDLFDRLLMPAPRRDLDVYLDLEDVAEVATVEMWSDAAPTENAGAGVYVRVDQAGTVLARTRRGNSLTTFGEHTPSSVDRLRLRLRKQEGVRSTLALDEWDGAGWQQVNEFEVTDDSLMFGRHVAMVAHDAGRRALLRLSADALSPADAFTLDLAFDRLTAWKLYQRGPDDHAPIRVPFSYTSANEVQLELQVVERDSGAPLPGFDFSDQSAVFPAAPGGASDSYELADVPTGGNYDIIARLLDAETDALIGERTVEHVAVGDVFLAAGQSNMSGYSGTVDPAEPPVDEVHLFGNDYRWKQASEPMDSGVDQIDLVSSENPAHTLMLRFAKEVSSASGVPVAVIPAPLGGTNLFSQWQRNDAAFDDRGTLYGSSVHRVLAQGYAHPIRGVLWYQGESDVGRGTATYLADLQNLVADYRADLGAPNLYFGNCQLATNLFANLPDWIDIQEAQRQQAAADPLSVVAALVDQPRSDTIHLNVAGYKETGVRLAALVLDELYGLPQTRQPVLTAIRFKTSQRRQILLEFDKEMTGGGSGLFQVLSGGSFVTVQSVVNDGNVVEVRLQGKAAPDATISYGFSVDPLAPWMVAVDGSGAALAFARRSIDP